MAKSLRSKWKRKMKAAKRVRYGAKELIRLKTMLENAEKKDVDMSEVFTRSDAKQINDEKESTTDKSEMDVDKAKKNFNTRTMKDEHGNYPQWMSQRAIQKKKGGTKKGKRKATWR